MKTTGSDAAWRYGFYGRWTSVAAVVVFLLTWGINWGNTGWFLWGCGACCVISFVGMGLIVWSNVLRTRQEDENRTW